MMSGLKMNKKLEEQRPSYHSPMFLKQYGKLHYEVLGEYGKVEIDYAFLNCMDDSMRLDVVHDWISELHQYRDDLRSEMYDLKGVQHE